MNLRVHAAYARSRRRPRSQRGQYHLPVTHAILSGAALQAAVLPRYELPRTATCRLWTRGLNDTYRVAAGRDDYVLRIYRAGWRTVADIHYELALLRHLDRKGVPIATPIAARDG